MTAANFLSSPQPPAPVLKSSGGQSAFGQPSAPYTRARKISGPFFLPEIPSPRGVPATCAAGGLLPKRLKSATFSARAVSAYCYGPRTRTCPRQKGSFPAIFQYGGRERSVSPPSDPKTRFAGFAVRTRRCGATGRMRRKRGPVREGGGMGKVRTWVRTRFAGLHPGQTKNGQDRKLNAGAGLQPIRPLGCRNRPSSLCAPSDASDTGCRNFP